VPSKAGLSHTAAPIVRTSTSGQRSHPNRFDEEGLGDVLQSTVSPCLREDVYATFEQMAKYHPSEPHWYLSLMGVDPRIKAKVMAMR
jgi:hypothetical protein